MTREQKLERALYVLLAKLPGPGVLADALAYYYDEDRDKAEESELFAAFDEAQDALNEEA